MKGRWRRENIGKTRHVSLKIFYCSLGEQSTLKRIRFKRNWDGVIRFRVWVWIYLRLADLEDVGRLDSRTSLMVVEVSWAIYLHESVIPDMAAAANDDRKWRMERPISSWIWQWKRPINTDLATRSIESRKSGNEISWLPWIYWWESPMKSELSYNHG